MKKKLLVFVLLLSAIFLVGCGKDDDEGSSSKKGASGAKEVLTTFLKAYKKSDAKAVCKTLLPEYLEDEYDDLEECTEQFKADINDYEDFDYEIGDYEEIEGEDYDDAVETLVDEYGCTEKKIGKIYVYDVEVSYKDDGERESEDAKLYVINYNNKWYMIF